MRLIRALKTLAIMAAAAQMGGCVALPLAVAIGSNAYLAAGGISRAAQADNDCRNFRHQAAQRGVQVILTPEQLRRCERVWEAEDRTSGRPTPVTSPTPQRLPPPAAAPARAR